MMLQLMALPKKLKTNFLVSTLSGAMEIYFGAEVCAWHGKQQGVKQLDFSTVIRQQRGKPTANAKIDARVRVGGEAIVVGEGTLNIGD